MSQQSHSPKPSVAVVIGRWQIPHIGHKLLIDAAFDAAQSVVIVIGSSFRSRDVRNPFNWNERKEMIKLMLSEDQLERVLFLPVRDYFDDKRWNDAVFNGVNQIHPDVDSLKIVGYEKDHTSYYLRNFPKWSLVTVKNSEFAHVDATSLRNVFFSTTKANINLSVLNEFISPDVSSYLQAWSTLPVFYERVKENLAVKAYKEKWTAPAYLTADAVVVANGHVLLVQRGGDVGYGQWALPGGFINPNEFSYNAALRELEEETQFRSLPSTMEIALKQSKVFEHPLRSARGRIVTTAYYFDMGNVALQEVKGTDDAMMAKWVPLSKLSSYEDQLFEDHAAILDCFGLLNRD